MIDIISLSKEKSKTDSSFSIQVYPDTNQSTLHYTVNKKCTNHSEITKMKKKGTIFSFFFSEINLHRHNLPSTLIKVSKICIKNSLFMGAQEVILP